MSICKVETELLKKLVSVSISCVSQSADVFINTLIGIKGYSDSSTIKLFTSDGKNNIIVNINNVDTDTFTIAVDASIFSKLISKLSSDTVEFNITDTTLEIIANGKYKIPLISDVNGLVDYPEPKLISTDDTYTISSEALKNIYNINKSSLYTDSDFPCITGYLLKNSRAISTNRHTVCFNSQEFNGPDMLISPVMMSLLKNFIDTKINYVKSNKRLMFWDSYITIIGPELIDIESYPDLLTFLDNNFEHSCKISKSELLSVLDRLSLFIQPYDANIAVLHFTDNTLKIYSKTNNFEESIYYKSSTNICDFTCDINIVLFKAQVSTMPDGNLTVEYNDNQLLKIYNNNIIKIMSGIK